MPRPPLPPRAYASLSAIYPLTGDNIPNDIEVAYTWYRAIAQIDSAVAGSDVDFPRGNNPIYLGTVTGLSTTAGVTTLTDSGATLPASFKRCGIDIADDNLNVHIFFRDDPRYVAKATLFSHNASAGTFQLSNASVTFGGQQQGSPADWVARGICPSITSLIGYQYRIYASDDYSPYDRWKNPPNDIEYVGNPTIAAQGLSGSTAIFPTSLITVGSQVTKGEYKIGINANGSAGTTDSVAWNATPADILSALTAVSAVGGDNASAVTYSTGVAVAFDPTILPVTLTVVSPNVSGGTVTIAPLSNVLVDTAQNWAAGQWTKSQPNFPGSPASFDLMTYDDGPHDGGTHGDQLVRRLTISGNGANNISTGSLGGWKPSLNFYYSIIGAGGWWSPRNLASPRLAWNTSKTSTDYGYTHMPDDSLAGYPVTALTDAFDPGDSLGGGDCLGPETYTVTNVDLINDCCDEGCCHKGNDIRNPDLFKSDLAIQQALIQRCYLPWVDPAWPGSAPTVRPPAMTFPVACRAAGIPTFSFTIGSLSTDKSKAYIGITSPWPDASMWYTLYKSDGSIDQDNSGVIPQKDMTGVYLSGNWSDDQIGETALATYGFYDPFNYEFKYPTDKVSWIASLDEFGNVINTPSISGGPSPIPAPGANAVAQSAGGPSISVTLDITGAQSCLLVFAAIGSDNDPGAASITDSQGQTWNYLGYVSPGSGLRGSVGCWYVDTAAVGSTTITFSPAGETLLTISAIEVTGAAGSNPVDASDSETANSSSPGASVTTTAANDYIVAFATYSTTAANYSSGVSWSAASGYSLIQVSSDPTIIAYAMEGKLAATAGSYGPQFTLGGSEVNTCWAVALKRGTQTAYLGQWRKRLASTHYLRHDTLLGSPFESGPAFQPGDLAAYIGDNAYFPTLPGYKSSAPGPTAQYQDYFYTGVNGPSPTNPLFKGRILDSTGKFYISTGVDAQGTGTNLMKGTVVGYGNTGGLTTQISISPTVDNNWLQQWYSTADDLSSTLTGTAASGTTTSLNASGGVLFDTSVWGCQIAITNASGGAVATATINGAGLTPHVLNFTPAIPFNASSGCSYSIVRPGCVLYTHTMNASSGSPTSFIATDSPGDVRFQPGIYDQGFTLNMFHPVGDGSQKLFKAFITATNQSTGTLTLIGPDDMTVSAGDIATIDWPKYEVSRFRQLTASFTAPAGHQFSSGSVVAVQLKGNDRNTLFIDSPPSGFTITDAMLAAGVTFNIESGTPLVVQNGIALPGSVFKRNAANTGWIIPTGKDNRTDPTTGKQPNFSSDPRNNEPFRFEWQGTIHIGTLSTAKMWNQMFALAQQFKARVGDTDWLSQKDPEVSENNRASASATNEAFYPSGGACGVSACCTVADRAAVLAFFNSCIAAALAGGGSTSSCDCIPSGSSTLTNTGPGIAPYKHSAYSYGAESYGPNQTDICVGVEYGSSNEGTFPQVAVYGYARATGLTSPYISGAVKFYNKAHWDVTEAVVTTEDPNGDGVNYLYSSTTNGPNVFEASGDEVANDMFTLWSSASPDMDGNVISDKLGSLTIITAHEPGVDPGTPVGGYYAVSGNETSGYDVIDALIIVPYVLPAIG